jgi:phage tail-like protein
MPEQQKTPWPVTSFSFKVSIDGYEVRFQEVSGLSSDAEQPEYRHSLLPNFGVQKAQGLKKYSEITMKKGVFKYQGAFPDIFVASQTPVTHEVSIALLDEFDTALISWTLAKAQIRTVKIVDIGVRSNDAAIEEMVFLHEGLTMEKL